MRTGATVAVLALVPLSFAACVVDLDFHSKGHSTTASSSVGSSSSGASSGTGGCVPEATVSCYDGPPGTENVGLCKTGLKTCSTAGLDFGPCVGAITPTPENCATPQDEDCDGLAPACQGTPLWSKRFGDDNNQFSQSMAVDDAHNVLVTGFFGGAVDFGDGPLVSAGGDDIFVLKLNANGVQVWSKRFGGADFDLGRAIAVDGAGNVVITGFFHGSVDFGGGQLDSAGGSDVFVLKLDADGNHVWSKRFGGSDFDVGRAVTVDGAGNVLVTGSFHDSADFGGGQLDSAGGDDILVLKLDAGGGHVWSKGFGDAADQVGEDIATDASGNVLVTGSFSGAVDFGGGQLSGVGGVEVFVAKLDPSGAHVWSKRFGDAADQYGASIAVDGVGNVLLTGGFYGAVDFGGGQLASAGNSDVFLAKLDASGGHIWSKRFGNGGDQSGNAVAADADGNVLITGPFTSAVDLGGGQLDSAGGYDIFVAKFSP